MNKATKQNARHSSSSSNKRQNPKALSGPRRKKGDKTRIPTKDIEIPSEVKIKPVSPELAKILPDLRRATGSVTNSKALYAAAMKFIDMKNEIAELRSNLSKSNYTIGVMADATNQLFSSFDGARRISEEIRKKKGQMQIPDNNEFEEEEEDIIEEIVRNSGRNK